MRGPSSYKTFGFRESWLAEFFEDPQKWWEDNTLGPVQFEAMKLYLKDCEIIDEKNGMTDLGKTLMRCGAMSPITWIVIWSKLFWKSVIFNSYSKLPWGRVIDRVEIFNAMKEGYSDATVSNGVLSLFDTLKSSPLKDLGIGNVIFEGRKAVAVEKKGLILNGIFEKIATACAVENASRELGTQILEYEFEGSPMEVFGLNRTIFFSIVKELGMYNSGKIFAYNVCLKLVGEWCS